MRESVRARERERERERGFARAAGKADAHRSRGWYAGVLGNAHFEATVVAD
jgi:hypothetical protein